MRAAVLRTAPGSLVIEDVSIPDPGPHHVVVRTAAAGVCHSDLHAVDGTFPTRVPAVIGHEASGVVTAVGDRVTELAVGDHVVVCLSSFCGACRACLDGKPFLCLTTMVPEWRARPLLGRDGEPIGRMSGIGAFAEAMLVHERAAVRIEPDLPLDVAALLGCAVTTGVGAVTNTASVRPGTSVAVIGCGGVGLNCIQGARLAGAATIVAVDLDPEKLALARRFGATAVVDGSGADVAAEVRALSGGGVDHAFEAVGSAATVVSALQMLTAGGTATLIGVLPAGQSVPVPAEELVMAGKRLQGSVMGSNRFRRDLPRYMEIYRQGRLELDGLVSSRIALDDVGEALGALRDGTATRTLIDFA